jgi:hypothetical protein
MESNDFDSFESMSYYEMLEAIYNGTLDPTILPKEVRQALVQILILRGLEQIQIAKLLKVSDRTIRRDVEDIWEQNALCHDYEFTRKFAGEVRLRAMSLIEILTRIANSSNNKMNDRINAVSQTWQSIKGLFETLQSLGFLPRDYRRAIPTDEVKKTAKLKDENADQISAKDKKEEKLKRRLEAMHPQEREKLRNSLFKEIKEMDRQDREAKAPPATSQPETPPKKDDNDPEVGSAAVTT